MKMLTERRRCVIIRRRDVLRVLEWLRHNMTEILALRGYDPQHPFLQWSPGASPYFRPTPNLYRWLEQSMRTLPLRDLLHRYGRRIYNFLAFQPTSAVRRSFIKHVSRPQIEAPFPQRVEDSLVLQIQHHSNIEYHVNLPKIYQRGLSFHQAVEADLKSSEERRLNRLSDSEYEDDFLRYLLEVEDAFYPDMSCLLSMNELLKKPIRSSTLTTADRDKAVEWLLDFQYEYKFVKDRAETIFLAINIFDRYLSITRSSDDEDLKYLTKYHLRLIAGVSFILAWKIDDGAQPKSSLLINLTYLPGFDDEDVDETEQTILKTLDYRVTPYCTAVDWMERTLNCATPVPEEMERDLGVFLLHICVANSPLSTWKPRKMAACALYTARRFLDLFWDRAFVYYSGGYEEASLVEGCRMILQTLGSQKSWGYPEWWSYNFSVADFAVKSTKKVLKQL